VGVRISITTHRWLAFVAGCVLLGGCGASTPATVTAPLPVEPAPAPVERNPVPVEPAPKERPAPDGPPTPTLSWLPGDQPGAPECQHGRGPLTAELQKRIERGDGSWKLNHDFDAAFAFSVQLDGEGECELLAVVPAASKRGSRRGGRWDVLQLTAFQEHGRGWRELGTERFGGWIWEYEVDEEGAFHLWSDAREVAHLRVRSAHDHMGAGGYRQLVHADTLLMLGLHDGKLIGQLMCELSAETGGSEPPAWRYANVRVSAAAEPTVDVEVLPFPADPGAEVLANYRLDRGEFQTADKLDPCAVRLGPRFLAKNPNRW